MYADYITKEFKPRENNGRPEGEEENPYHALLELPIRRFVTTNYDCEIETALRDKKKNAFPELFESKSSSNRSRSERPRSFTQQPEFLDQLAIFAMTGAEAAHNMVFHCHGRYDRVASIISTEEDYQRWYLSDLDGAGPAFRQTIDLLFGSNPILFLGYGLEDEDLLRPLRMFSAVDPKRKDSQPLFALLRNKPEDLEYHEYLYDRFGLHVIPYADSGSSDPKVWGKDLCKALADIKNDRLRWRDGWLQKPMIRKVMLDDKIIALMNTRVTAQSQTGADESTFYHYQHYGITPDPTKELGKGLVLIKLEEMKKAAIEKYSSSSEVPSPLAAEASLSQAAASLSQAAASLSQAAASLSVKEASSPNADASPSEAAASPPNETPQPPEYKKSVITLVGPGGTGESWLALL